MGTSVIRVRAAECRRPSRITVAEKGWRRGMVKKGEAKIATPRRSGYWDGVGGTGSGSLGPSSLR